MKHVFVLEPFIRPVDEVGLLVPLVTSLRKVTNGTKASLVTFFKKNTNEITALPIPSLVTFS
jgi:hypothetical protein